MIDKLKAICRSQEKRTKFIFLLGIIGMLILLCSEFVPQKSETDDLSADDTEFSLDETMKYKENIESQLEDIISQISGVGSVKVLITVRGTKELIYLEQSEVSRRTDSGSEDLSQKSEIIFSDENNENQPVVKKIITPEICGAIVVCEGASDAKTKERVVNALTAALGIGSSKISVEPM